MRAGAGAAVVPYEAVPVQPVEARLAWKEALNWDVFIAAPPSRPRGTIQAQMTYRGRSQPMPVSDPNAD